jgi:hypothetical protein
MFAIESDDLIALESAGVIRQPMRDRSEVRSGIGTDLDVDQPKAQIA